MSDQVIAVAATFYAPAERIVSLVGALEEWGVENGSPLAVRRSAHEEVLVSIEFPAGELDNGTVSAVTWLSSLLDRALSELSPYRWFGPVTFKSGAKVSRDELDHPEDGDEKTVSGEGDEESIPVSFSDQVAAEEEF
jgi:hypothetical protein